MITLLLLLLFTGLCILLSGDRAWDNVTKPERNAVVFDGRHRGYGAFVLRRDYDRRFVWAFVGALGLFGAGIALPHALASMGILKSVPKLAALIPPIDDHEIAVIIDLPPKPDVPPATAVTPPAPTRSTPDEKQIMIVPKDSVPLDPGPVAPINPVAPGPVSPGPVGPVGPITPPGPVGGQGGTELGGSGSGKWYEQFEVEHIPEFVGGPTAMKRFIQDNLRYDELGGADRIKEWVEFIVDKDGTVIGVKSKGKSSKAFSEAAARVVRAMPKWTPALLKSGETAACRLVLPIELVVKD